MSTTNTTAMGPLLFPAANEILAEGVLEALGPRGSRLVSLTEFRTRDDRCLEVGVRELMGVQGERAASLVLSPAQAAALLPQANLNVSDEVERLNLTAFLGKSIPGFPQHAGPFQVFQAGPDFSTPVFDLTLFRRYQEARNTMDASKADSLSTGASASFSL